MITAATSATDAPMLRSERSRRTSQRPQPTVKRSHGVRSGCPLRSVYFSRLWLSYVYRFSACGYLPFGTTVSAWTKRPRAGSYQRAR